MDDQLRRELEEAADDVVHGRGRLRAAIFRAADAGERAADITKAIGHAYTYDYVARLVRERRGPSKGPRKQDA